MFHGDITVIHMQLRSTLAKKGRQVIMNGTLNGGTYPRCPICGMAAIGDWCDLPKDGNVVDCDHCGANIRITQRVIWDWELISV